MVGSFEEKAQEVKTKMKKLLLTYILTIGICAVAGVSTGIILKKTIGPIDETYPPGFDPKEFSPDVDAIWKKYEALSDKSINGVKSFSDADVVNVSLEKFRRCENCYSYSVGDAKTIVTQTIRNAQIKNGEEYYEDQISYSSMVALAKRSYQHGKDGPIIVHDGSPRGAEDASFPESPTKTYEDKQDYKDFLGKTLDEMFIYVISDKTTIDSSRTTRGDDVVIKMNLNPNLSTFYYKTQMLNLSGLSNLPPFEEVKLTYTLGKDLVLKHLSIDETFTATKEGIPVPAKTNNVIDIYYHADEYLKIPSWNEQFDFSIKNKEA